MSQNILFPTQPPNYPYSSPLPPADDLQFTQFSYSERGGSTNTTNTAYPSYPDTTSTYNPGPNGPQVSYYAAFSTGDYPDEPPLLEELGIRFDHVQQKALTVLNLFRPVDKNIMDDPDIVGPLIFLIALGGFLLLAGKVHFGYIYGLAMLGCVSLGLILNLMSETGIDGYKTASVLGYCLLPMVILSALYALFHLTGLDILSDGIPGLILSSLTILWCTHSASLIFVTILQMNEQRLLVAYPVGLFYIAFALLTVFDEVKDAASGKK
ncbi:hypothetical protein HK098_006693 [Nowakowskiella sp. JEL0407]|nr:hypothetical protein HK098_006693 [Nowakowskiella sp. JEL0407]